MEKTFEEMMGELKKGEWLGGRKLTFVAKCGAFAALYGGASNQIVARAFDISPQTVSKLSGCLENDPDPYRREWTVVRDGKRAGDEIDAMVLRDHNRNRSTNRALHYRDVAEEFEALGKTEFLRRYYTQRIHDRIIQAKETIRQERRKNQNNSPTSLD